MTDARSVRGGGLAIGLVLAASSLFAQVQRQETTTVQTSTGSTTQIRTVSTVVGSTVRLQGGAAYGKIEDIVLNDSGCLEYVVIAYEDQYYVVPWSVATVNYQEKTIALNVTQQDIRQVAFSRNDWRGVTYDQVSQRAQKAFSAAAAGRGGRANQDGDRAPSKDGVRARSKDGDRDDPSRPAGKAKRDDRPRAGDDSPDRARPGDRDPGKRSDRPQPKDKSARPKGEVRPGPDPAGTPKPAEPPK